MLDIEKNPKIKADIGWLNLSGYIKTYFIISNPSLAAGKQVK